MKESEIREHVANWLNTRCGQSCVEPNTECPRIAFITSGGTRVKLDGVRSIENFSMGMRGAASAEYFLKQGYHVIFFHREGSLKPFMHKLQHKLFLAESLDALVNLQCDFGAYDQYRGNILFIPFTDLDQYLTGLRAICEQLRPCGPNALVYLAAAVSDFQHATKQVTEHKIQSQEGDLQLTLSVVPKMLDRIVEEVIPRAYVVSFKLETDERILVKKAKGALEKYGHRVVIANLLHTRKREVIFIYPGEPNVVIRLSDAEMESGVEIEERIVAQLAQEHGGYIANPSS